MTHPSVDKHIKRIQSQLTRQDVRLTKDQIRAIYLDLVDSPANPTEEERTLVVEKLSQPPERSGELLAVGKAPVEEPALGAIALQDGDDVWEDSGIGETIATGEQSSLTIPSTSGGALEFPANNDGQLTETEVTQAITQAIAQVGESGSAEAKQIMTQLALQLSGDINTLEQAVATLVTGYLNKRTNVLKNAMGALNTLRNAQTNSFCGGLTPDFLIKQEIEKKQLMKIANIFN